MSPGVRAVDAAIDSAEVLVKRVVLSRRGDHIREWCGCGDVDARQRRQCVLQARFSGHADETYAKTEKCIRFAIAVQISIGNRGINCGVDESIVEICGGLRDCELRLRRHDGRRAGGVVQARAGGLEGQILV